MGNVTRECLRLIKELPTDYENLAHKGLEATVESLKNECLKTKNGRKTKPSEKQLAWRKFFSKKAKFCKEQSEPYKPCMKRELKKR